MDKHGDKEYVDSFIGFLGEIVPPRKFSDSMLSKTLVILVSGHIGAGKTTFAKMLVDLITANGYKAVKMSFADRIKHVAANHFFWGGGKDEKGRKLLQDLGMAGRAYNPNLWVGETVARIISKDMPYDVVIIDDWRFPNEYEVIRTDELLNVITVKIVRDLSIKNDHEFENALDGFSKFDIMVYNSKGIYELMDACETLVDKLDLVELKPLTNRETVV